VAVFITDYLLVWGAVPSWGSFVDEWWRT